MADRFHVLVSRLEGRRPVFVQTHDYPDIDAVASAWGLAGLLRRMGFSADCGYRGELRSRSLKKLVKELDIDLKSSPEGESEIQVIVVDGSPGNDNVTLNKGELIGVIDHHYKSGESEAAFIDLRPELASCSTMIFGYWKEAGFEPPRGVATALLAGIQSDTDFLSRSCSDEDFAAYAALYRAGDWDLASRVVRTVLDLRELGLVVSAIGKAVVRDGLLFAFIRGACGQEALAVLAEFALRSEELSAAVAAEKDDRGVHISVRSKSASVSAFGLVRAALAGIGGGGGHAHSAGGLIPAASDPGERALRERFFKAASAAYTATEAAARS
jgi:nanoRNase/pAp phosphatase (c-di-AMP/oligoRNAs hydrolase)